MAERWATFDCYGTLVDWNRGIGDALTRLWPDAGRAALLDHYHRIEPEVQAEEARPYRDVLGETTLRVAAALDLPVTDEARTTLAGSLPSWSPFPEVPAALEGLRADGWRLAILSNVDPDLLGETLPVIGVPVDLTVTVADAGSYKPAPGHWQTFRERSDAGHHVHVAGSLFHDIAPCAKLGVPAVWINRDGEFSDLPRAAELPDCSRLPETLAGLIER
jgi:2-haloacid dehalogenase